jgi:hypothetical protein
MESAFSTYLALLEFIIPAMKEFVELFDCVFVHF